MALKRKKNTGFLAKERKELGNQLLCISEEIKSDVSEKAIAKVSSSVHVRHHGDRKAALDDPKGKQQLIDCVIAMCDNFCSFYLTFMPGKKYVEFQHVWFMHIRHYMEGSKGMCSILCYALSGKTRTGRKRKNHGASSFVEADQCKHLWAKFVSSVNANLSPNDQRIIVASLAYEVYDLMCNEVKGLKKSKFNVESKAPVLFNPSPEDESVIHRYLGFAIKSLIDQKQSKLTKSNLSVPQENIYQQQLKVLQLLIVSDTDEIPDSVARLSQGGLTHVSSKMIKYGGDILLEFSKTCGTQFNRETAEISQSLVMNDQLKKCFKGCVSSIINDVSINITENIMDNLFIEISCKITNSRINELLQAQREIDLEKSGKVVNASQSLRDTLKTFSISKERKL